MARVASLAWLGGFAVATAVVAASDAGAGQPSAAGYDAIAETTAVVARVRQAIRRNKLTALREECLTFDVALDHSPRTILVDVREKHDRACGGDHGTAPRLFSVTIDKRTKRMSSDANSPDAEFRALK